MKNESSEFWYYIFIIISLLVLVYAFIDVIRTNDDWLRDLTLYSLSVAIASIIMIVIVNYKRSKSISRKKFYISYSEDNKEQASRIITLLPSNAVINGISNLYPGENMENIVPAYVKNSDVCYVLLGNRISHVQKKEITIMRNFKKLIIPVLLDENVNIPQNLRDKKYIFYDEFVNHPYIP